MNDLFLAGDIEAETMLCKVRKALKELTEKQNILKGSVKDIEPQLYKTIISLSEDLFCLNKS